MSYPPTSSSLYPPTSGTAAPFLTTASSGAQLAGLGGTTSGGGLPLYAGGTQTRPTGGFMSDMRRFYHSHSKYILAALALKLSMAIVAAAFHLWGGGLLDKIGSAIDSLVGVLKRR